MKNAAGHFSILRRGEAPSWLNLATISGESVQSLSLRLAQPPLPTPHMARDVEASNLQCEQALIRLSNAVACLAKLQAFSLYVPAIHLAK